MKSPALLTLSLALGLGIFAAETKLKVEDLPPAVQAALKDQTKGATIMGASKEMENGRLTYEVETRLNGKLGMSSLRQTACLSRWSRK